MSRNDYILNSIVKALDESDRRVKPMTVDKLTSILKSYRQLLDAFAQGPPSQNPRDPTSPEHLLYMCDRCLNEYIPQERIHKAMRWLGFIQGILVARYRLTLDDIRTHSRKSDQST